MSLAKLQAKGLHVITSLPGPWQVCSGSRGWHIGNLENGRSKYVGKAGMKGDNFCDRARDLASERNAEHACRYPAAPEPVSTVEDITRERDALRSALETLYLGCKSAGHSTGIEWALQQAADTLRVNP